MLVSFLIKDEFVPSFTINQVYPIIARFRNYTRFRTTIQELPFRNYSARENIECDYWARFRNYDWETIGCDSGTTIRKLFRAIQKLRLETIGCDSGTTIRKLFRAIQKLRLETIPRDSETTIWKLSRAIQKLRF